MLEKGIKKKLSINLQNEFNLLKDKIDVLDEKLVQINDKITILNTEFFNIPNHFELSNSFEVVKTAQFEYDMCQNNVLSYTEKEKVKYEELTKIKELVYGSNIVNSL